MDLSNYSVEEVFGTKNLPVYPFYNGSVFITYDDNEHSYTRPDENDGIVKIAGVTTFVHIIDKSAPLTQWAANLTSQYVRDRWAEAPPSVFESYGSFFNWLDTVLEEARFNFKAVVDNAADIGKIAHGCLEESIKHALKTNNGVVKELVNLPELAESANCANAAFRWMVAHKVVWIFTERKIYSRTYDYAGTMDGLAWVSSCDDPKCCREQFSNRLAVIDWKSSNRLYDEYRYQTALYAFAHEEEFTEHDIQDRWINRLGKDNDDFEPWHLTEKHFEQDLKTGLCCLNLYRSIEQGKQMDRDEKQFDKEKRRAEKEAAEAAEKAAKAEAKAKAKAAREAEELWVRAEAKRTGRTLKSLRAELAEAKKETLQ